MPYIKESRRKALFAGEQPQDFGELNFLISLELINRWEALPRYETIAQLHMEFFAFTTPNKFLVDVTLMNKQFKHDQVYSASQLAYLEFYRRIGSKYEDLKAQENGDVYKYVSIKGKVNAK